MTIFLGSIQDPRIRSAITVRYGVMIADPPWVYENQAPGASTEVYPTMSDEEIINLHLGEFMLDRSVLGLWTTWSKLEIGMKCLRAWGFEYKSGCPWVKVQDSNHSKVTYGLGFWFRGCTEPILIGVRGGAQPPLDMQWAGILSENFDHSRKPDSLHEYMESLPGPYLEVFGRRSRTDWDTVGLEIDNLRAPDPPSLESIEEFRLGQKFMTKKSDSIYELSRISEDGKIQLREGKYIRWVTPKILRFRYSEVFNELSN